MASKIKTKSMNPVTQMVRGALNELKQDFPDDERLDLSDADEVRAPQSQPAPTGRKKKDEILMDAIFSGIAGKDGYFAKLKKEVRPGEWMMMKVYETEWRQWPDAEVAVTNIVRDYTRLSPHKWGSGTYRIEMGCHGGIRGEQPKVTDYCINADEEFNTLPGSAANTHGQTDPSVQVASQLESMRNLMDMVRGFFPQAPDPSKTQELVGNAFQQGMQMKIGEGSNNSNLMLGMMTMFKDLMISQRSPIDVTPKSLKSEMLETFGMLKDIGVLNPPKPEKTIMDLLGELKLIGFDPFKSQNPLDSLGQVKDIVRVVKDITGKVADEIAEKPGMFEEIAKSIGPFLPQILTALQGAGVGAGMGAGMGAVSQLPMPQAPQQINPPVNPPSQPGVSEPMPNPQPKIDPGLMLLYEAVIGRDMGKFPTIITMIQSMNGGNMMLNQLKNGNIAAEQFYGMVQSWTQPVMHDQQFKDGLREFVEKFVQYVKNPTPTKAPSVSPTFDAKCPLCGMMYAFDSAEQFINDTDKICGNESMKDGQLVKCPGMLVQMRQAS